MRVSPIEIEKKEQKTLYDYQRRDIDKIFSRLEEFKENYNFRKDIVS